MRIVDARGRVFGTINLIDLGVLLFVAVLIPLAYGAYALFRTPPPRLTAVMPDSVVFSKGVERRVQVQGDHLRPFLRAKIGGLDAMAFSLQSPGAAEIRFTDHPPGTYDIVLLDESQEVARLPHALTILPPPIRALGWFTGPSAADGRLVPGVKLGPADRPVAELLDVAPTVDAGKRQATLRLTCQWSAADFQCLTAGSVLRAGTELKLTFGGADPLTFLVSDLRIDTTWLRVKVRLMGLPEALDRIRPADVDTPAPDPSVLPESPVYGVTTGAILLSLGERQKNQGSYSITATRVQPGAPLSAFNVLSAAVPVDSQAAELIVPVRENLVYRGVAVRPGNVVPFETKDYRVEALIMGTAGS